MIEITAPSFPHQYDWARNLPYPVAGHCAGKTMHDRLFWFQDAAERLHREAARRAAGVSELAEHLDQHIKDNWTAEEIAIARREGGAS